MEVSYEIKFGNLRIPRIIAVVERFFKGVFLIAVLKKEW
jgi:hypothetical protein